MYTCDDAGVFNHLAYVFCFVTYAAITYTRIISIKNGILCILSILSVIMRQ
jgi:hypothetical protein